MTSEKIMFTAFLDELEKLSMRGGGALARYSLKRKAVAAIDKGSRSTFVDPKKAKNTYGFGEGRKIKRSRESWSGAKSARNIS